MSSATLPFPNTPLFERRGLMLDISRNRVPTMGMLKWLIDRLADLRYNELQLYTEHTFAYSEHRAVWQNASPMSASEIRDLDRYCSERGIELVPNQNSFGHMERWLKHKQYKALAESPDGFEHPIAGWRGSGSTLYPSPESAAFIDALYGELLSNFSSRFLHIGGDEPWELGKGRSLAAVQAKGKHRVYLDFLKKLFGITQKYGRYPQFWADVILERPDLVPELPKGACPIIWGYEADSPFEKNCRIVSKAGFKDNFYVAPGAGNWNSFSGRLDVARANIALAAEAGSAHRASGFLLTAWGDNGHLQPWPTLYPALILGALATWGISETNAPLAASIDSIFYQDQPPGNGNALCLLG
ncbi:MAG: beta-N-acetylhexosaminidase, partial [Verrucomicrobiota bacterium]